MAIRNEDLKLRIIIGGDPVAKKMGEIERSMKDLEKSLDGVNDRMRTLKKEGKSGSQEYKTLAANAKELQARIKDGRAEFDRLNQSVGVNHKTMKQLRSEIKQTKSALANAVPGTENFKNLEQTLRQLQVRLDEVSSGARGVQGVFQKLSRVKAGVLAVAAATAAAVRGISNAFSKIADFEQANADLSTILGKSVEDIAALTQSAMDLGRTTEYTASEVTQLQTELAKLGFGESDIAGMQEAVLHFATALGASLPEAAELAGATLRMFDLQAADSEDALAVLTQGANRSALGFSYYQTAMSIVGPVAKTFNFSLRDTVALLGTLANSGFDASSAATATRNILLNLADSSGKLATALGHPVKSFGELMEGLRSLDEQGVDLATTLELTDKRSVSAFNTFLHGVDSAEELRDSLNDVNGVLKETAEARLNTVQGSVKMLQSAWEGLILSFRNSSGIIKSVIDWLTKIVNIASRIVNPSITATEGWNEYFAGIQNAGGDVGTAISEARDSYNSGMAYYQSVYDNPESSRKDKRRARKNLRDYRTQLSAIDTAALPYESAGTSDTSAAVSSSVGDGADVSVGDKKKTWSLEADESYLQAKAALTKEYNDGVIATEDEYNARLTELTVASLTARLALHKEKGADRAKLEAQLQDTIMKQKKSENDTSEKLAKEGASIIASAETDKTKSAMDAEDLRYKEELKKFKESRVAYENQAAVIEAIERKHQNNLAKIEKDAFDRNQQERESRYKKERQDRVNEYDRQIAEAPKYSAERAVLIGKKEKALSVFDLSYLQDLQAQLSKIVNAKSLGDIKLPTDELEKYELKLREVEAQIISLTDTQNGKTAGLFSGAGGGSLFGVSQDQWNQLFANLENGENKAQSMVTILSAVGGAAKEGFSLASQAIEMTAAQENKALKSYEKDNEKKKKSLKARLDAGIVSESQYNAEVEALDEEYDAYKEELSLKQAKREKALKLAQTIFDTAQSVTKTLAQFGATPAGIAAAAIAAALGAAKTALIAATPVVSGAEEGGYVFTRRKQDGRTFKARLSPDSRGFVSSPTVLVGENGGEYVIPADGLENPSLQPIIASMETARRNGTLRDLNFAAVYPPVLSAGRAAGGFTASSSDSGDILVPVAASDPELLAAIKALNRVLSSPIRASVSMLGDDGIVRQKEKYDRYRNRGKL